jgi:hypothetical protein
LLSNNVFITASTLTHTHTHTCTRAAHRTPHTHTHTRAHLATLVSVLAPVKHPKQAPFKQARQASVGRALSDIPSGADPGPLKPPLPQ